jgi:hypothetical protein
MPTATVHETMEMALLDALEPALAAVRDGSLVFRGSTYAPPDGVYDLRATLRFLGLGAGVGTSKREGGSEYEAFRVNHWRAVKSLVAQGKLQRARYSQGLQGDELRWVRCPGGLPERVTSEWVKRAIGQINQRRRVSSRNRRAGFSEHQ